MSDPAGTRSQELFALLGERWNHGILREVFFGTHRFGALQRTLGIAPNTLTARLGNLVEIGMLERRRYRPDKDWFDYHLTASAQEIVPLWIAFARWAETNVSGQPGPGRVIAHATCGEDIDPVVVCSHCRLPLTGGELRPSAGPAPEAAEA